jgi:hypothetical protein
MATDSSMAAYRADELRRTLAAGPYDGEDWFRMQVRGAESSNWINVTPAQLERIAAIMAEPA